MISYIRGELVSIEDDKVIVDVNGVGFGIFMPAQSMNLLPSIGEEVKLHTYMNVREDAMQLYGFLTRDDLQVFKLVIGVSGIGPKGGLGILSKLSADELRFAVMAHDVKTISSAPGIGKKTAEKLIIELNKYNLVDRIIGQTKVLGNRVLEIKDYIENSTHRSLYTKYRTKICKCQQFFCIFPLFFPNKETNF